jgi:hypothetical protein
MPTLVSSHYVAGADKHFHPARIVRRSRSGDREPPRRIRMGWGFATAAAIALGLLATMPGMVFAQNPDRAQPGCPTPDDKPQKSTRAFVEAYVAATRQLQSHDFATAASTAETALAGAAHMPEGLAAENIRLAAYLGLRDKARAAAVLQTMKETGCLSPDDLERKQASIDRLDQPN